MSRPRHLVGALLCRDGRLLLGRRSPLKQNFPGAWDLFGGHVEPDETFIEALARELEEELGVTLVAFKELASAALSDGGRYRIYRVDRWRGGEPTLCNDEHVELAWFSPADASSLSPLASDLYRPLFAAAAARHDAIADRLGIRPRGSVVGREGLEPPTRPL